MINTLIGDKIKELRKKHNMSQENLAEAINVSTVAVHKWESNKSMHTVSNLIDIACVFEVSVDSILEYTVDKTAKSNACGRATEYIVRSDYKGAVEIMEETLRRYPNDYTIINYTAQMYSFYMYAKNTDKSIWKMCAVRKEELYRRALEVLPDDEHKYENANKLWLSIAECKKAQGNIKEALVILEDNNAFGICNSQIASMYVENLHQPDEAIPFASDAFSNAVLNVVCTTKTIGAIFGMQGKYKMAIDAMMWLLSFVDSLRYNVETDDPFEVLKVEIIIQLAIFYQAIGERKTSEEYLESCIKLIVRLTKNDERNLENIRFKLTDGNEKVMIFDLQRELKNADRLIKESGFENLIIEYERLKNAYNL